MVFHSADAFAALSEKIRALPLPGHILMVEPTYFQVEYVINEHMKGHIGTVDPPRARTQWEALASAYRDLGLEVHVLSGVEGLPDLVFCANQTLPWQKPDGSKGVVLSRMFAAARQPEVPVIARDFQARGYETLHLDLPESFSFEGMGDALWHPGRFLLWGGYGFRTDRHVYDALSQTLGCPVLALHLEDPVFYHLDTCLCLLDADTALIAPAAFNEEGLALLHGVFGRIIEAPDEEARSGFACNAHCPDGRHVFIQRGNAGAVSRLRAHGFEPIELETGEFMKSGGSVFCMKLAHW